MADFPAADAEQAMIAKIFAPLAAGLPGALGLQDDAAVLSVSSDRQLVVTMDTAVADVHFLFDGTPQQAADAAYKALGVNVSDLVAKAADPLAYLLSLTLPPTGAGDWLPGLAEGLRQGQEDWGIHLAGGDTVRGRAGLALTVTALGSVPCNKALLRGTARPGDRLLVTGTIGDAWAGLQLCRLQAIPAGVLSSLETNGLIARYQRPEPRIGMIEPLRQFASAAMDVSDGLLLDLERLCRASDVGAKLHAYRVPMSRPVRQLVEDGIASMEAVLSGGDDYEILAAVPSDNVAAFAAAANTAGVPVTEVGEVVGKSDGVGVLDTDGGIMRVSRKGWDHLSDVPHDPPC